MRNLKSFSEKGYTLAEVSLVTVILGVLAAQSVPSFMDMLPTTGARGALSETVQALRMAQRSAMLQSKACTIILQLDGKTTPTEIPTSDKCQTQLINVRPDVKIASSSPDNLVKFDFRGNTSSELLLVFYVHPTKGTKKCLVISNGLGLIREGEYEGTIDSTGGTFKPEEGKCNTTNYSL